jgi:hypothetical protein
MSPSFIMGFARRVLIDDDRMVAEGAAFGRASELILSALLADEGRSPMNAMGSILWIVDEDGEEEEEGRLSLRLVIWIDARSADGWGVGAIHGQAYGGHFSDEPWRDLDPARVPGMGSMVSSFCGWMDGQTVWMLVECGGDRVCGSGVG